MEITWLQLYIGLVVFIANSYQQQMNNTGIVVNDTARLVVLAPKGSVWLTWTELISSGGEPISDNGTVKTDHKFASRYQHTIVSHGNDVISTLIISDVQLADAGLYKAEYFGASNSAMQAELVVLEDDINCTLANSENSANDYVESGDAILITCGFTYQGKWAPVITCTGSGFENWTSNVTTTGGDVTYELTADVNSEQVSPSDVTCTAAFVDPKPEDYITDHARNIPEFTSTWTGGIIKHYPPSDLQISPTQSAFDVDDVIECTSSGGNPEPTITWSNLATGAILANTTQLTVTAALDGVMVRCIAGGLTKDVTIVIASYTEWSGWCAKCGGCGQQKRNRMANGAAISAESRQCEAKRCFKSINGRGEIRRSHRNRLIMREWMCCYSWKNRPLNSPRPIGWSRICKNVMGFVRN